jgi:hypothetical protein
VNETQMPHDLRAPLEDELTADALRLLDERSRLDRLLWLDLADERISGVKAAALGDEVFRRACARYGELMAA